jgi:hypothetical protein
MDGKEKRLEEISASITRYYDLLTDEEVAEDRAWGEFAAIQFAEPATETRVGPQASSTR